jgi:hypothetical protein
MRSIALRLGVPLAIVAAVAVVGSPSVGAIDRGAPWTGKWALAMAPANVLTLTQTGATVTGTYTWAPNGSVSGTVAGDTVTGNWSDAKEAGTFTATLDPTRQSFTAHDLGQKDGPDSLTFNRVGDSPPPPPAPPQQPSRSFVVTEGTYKLSGVPSCVRTDSTFQVTLSFKRAKRKGNVVVKIARAVFTYQGDRVYTAKRSPYRATVRVRGAKAGKTYSIRARAFLKVRHGKARSRSIGQTVKGCSP